LSLPLQTSFLQACKIKPGSEVSEKAGEAQSYRSCLGIMSLAKKPGGTPRLEDTCGRALAATPSPSYTLIKKLWATWQPTDPPPAASLGDAGFVRGAGYYGGQA
jgi:hypothetical protein